MLTQASVLLPVPSKISPFLGTWSKTEAGRANGGVPLQEDTNLPSHTPIRIHAGRISYPRNIRTVIKIFRSKRRPKIPHFRAEKKSHQMTPKQSPQNCQDTIMIPNLSAISRSILDTRHLNFPMNNHQPKTKR